MCGVFADLWRIRWGFWGRGGVESRIIRVKCALSLRLIKLCLLLPNAMHPHVSTSTYAHSCTHTRKRKPNTQERDRHTDAQTHRWRQIQTQTQTQAQTQTQTQTQTLLVASRAILGLKRSFV